MEEEEWLAEEYYPGGTPPEVKKAGSTFYKYGDPHSAMILMKYFASLGAWNRAIEMAEWGAAGAEAIEDIFREELGWQIYYDFSAPELGQWRDAETNWFISTATIERILDELGYRRY